MTLHVRAARAVLALAFVAPAANGVSAQSAASATCDQAVRSHQTLQELLGFVERLKDARPIWTSYGPASASYVLLVPGSDKGRCAAIWRDGAVRSVFRMTAAPRLDTPLYGFYRPTQPEDQPSELREQLQAAGVREAVILPQGGHNPVAVEMLLSLIRSLTGPAVRLRADARA